MIRSDRVFDFRFPPMRQKICDYRFQSIKLTNQSTNIEYYRLIDYIFNDRFRSIRYVLLIQIMEEWEEKQLKDAVETWDYSYLLDDEVSK